MSDHLRAPRTVHVIFVLFLLNSYYWNCCQNVSRRLTKLSNIIKFTISSATTYIWSTYRRIEYHWVRLHLWASVESTVGGYNPALSYAFPQKRFCILWCVRLLYNIFKSSSGYYYYYCCRVKCYDIRTLITEFMRMKYFTQRNTKTNIIKFKILDYHWIRLLPWVSVESVVGGYNHVLVFKFPHLWTATESECKLCASVPYPRITEASHQVITDARKPRSFVEHKKLSPICK